MGKHCGHVIGDHTMTMRYTLSHIYVFL